MWPFVARLLLLALKPTPLLLPLPVKAPLAVFEEPLPFVLLLVGGLMPFTLLGLP
jgi:hypothetical protein